MIPRTEAAATTTLPPHRDTGPEPVDGAPSSYRATDFFAELKRRKVYRVGAAYLAIAFAALEGADLVFPTLGVAPVVYNGLVLVSLLGFPLALFLAWTFDVTPGGELRRTDEPGNGEGRAEEPVAFVPDRWGRLKAALVGAGFVAVLVLGMRMWKGPVAGDGSGAGDRQSAVPTAEPVLAVLPFTDLSPGGDQAYFADGLHEELLHQLAVLRGLHLTSRTSAEHFRGSPSTVRAIADSLGARYVMEGSVRRAGDSVRVTVQLIDAAADEHIWSESYDARLTLDEIFAVQTRIAEGVAGSLGGTFAAGARGRLGRAPTSSLDAYNFYLRALYHYNRARAEDLELAAAELERAIALDPEFGRAHGLLGLVYVVLRNQGMRSTDEAFPVVRRQAEIAMRLAPDEPESRMAQTAVYWTLEWDWEAARRQLERVLELDPNSSLAPWALAEWYGVIAGDTEQGLRQIADARLVDPLSPRVDQMEAWVLYVGRRNSESAEILERVHRAEPDDPLTALYLAQMRAAAGRRDEAVDLLSGVLPNVEDWQRVEVVIAYAELGEIELAREHMARALAFRESGGQLPASDISLGFASIGEIEAALDWLERSFREEGGSYMLRHPGFDSLRGEPRFQALWDEVGLPGAPPEL